MGFTLLVTGLGRRDELDRFFRSVGKQTFAQEIELIFVNQSASRPSCCDVLPASVRCVELRTGGRVSLSKARNIGLREFSGDIIAFPDDDCWYEPRLLEKIAIHFQNNPNLDCICTNVYDPGENISYGKRPPGVTRSVSFGSVFMLCISVGIFVRRAALLRAGAFFDESLGAGTRRGAGEETELLTRLLSAGCRIDYVGSLQVYHPTPKYSGSDVGKNYRYGVGYGHLIKRVLCAGHPAALWVLVEILARSIGGAIVNFRRPLFRALYWNRAVGIVSGFADALAPPVEEKH